MEYFVEMATHARSGLEGSEFLTTLESLPRDGWMRVESTPLSVHPNDPVNGTRS